MNLAEGLVAEIRRVTEIRETYLSIGPPGMFGAALMKAELDRAQRVIASGDVVEMLKVHQSLKGFEK